jgi:putative endonuclease
MPRSPDDRRRALRAGADAEERVASLLAADGWSVLARNWRGGGGELDVVVARGVAVRFVEVKLRDPADPLGDEAVSASKRSRLRSAARAWLLSHSGLDPHDLAFLVAFVAPDGVVRLVDDAFDG